MSLTLIETIELDSSQSSITFSSIPQDYDDLVLLVNARTTEATVGSTLALDFNSVSTNQSRVVLFGTGSGTGSQTVTNLFFNVVGASATSSTFGNVSIYISNYTASEAKSISYDIVNENNSTASVQAIQAGLWNDTSAITSITLDPSVGNIDTGTTASLYGVTAGGDGTVTTS